MNKAQRERLHLMGGRETTVTDFLGMSPAEERMMETRLALANLVRDSRKDRGWSQTDLADKMGTQQPNIARMEIMGAGFEIIFQALYVLGLTPEEVGKALAHVKKPSSAVAPADCENLQPA